MCEHTWIDTAGALVAPLTDWISSQAKSGHVGEFSPKQLELLQKLLKAGMTGTANIMATHLSYFDARIAKLESGNSCQFAEAAASIINPDASERDALACGFIQKPVFSRLEELIPFEPDAITSTEKSITRLDAVLEALKGQPGH